VKNKNVIVTGGAQGIGKCVSKVFAQAGARVIMADIDEEAGKEAEKEIENTLFIKTDVSSEKDIKSLFLKAVTADVVVNNAGIGINKPVTELSLDEWNVVINTNLTSVFLCAKYGAPLLKKNKGSIINIASTRAFMSEPDTEAYSASKGGIIALTHSLAVSLGPDIRVNSISPGWIEVSEWKKKSAREKPDHTKEDREQHPAGRVGVPDDIAQLALYLASEKAGFMTGQNFIVDGGMTRKMIYV